MATKIADGVEWVKIFNIKFSLENEITDSAKKNQQPNDKSELSSLDFYSYVLISINSKQVTSYTKLGFQVNFRPTSRRSGSIIVI